MKPNLHHFVLAACLGATTCSAAETPAAALLVLNKGDNTLAIVDPVAAKVIARLPSGPDPHEVVASKGLAFISNYGGNNTLSVVNLVAQKALAPINLGALRSPHGLWVAEGKVYFTAEANKIIGRYDPAAQQIDWLLGLGQERTHMIVVSPDAKRIYTSNVNSDTISLVERGSGPGGLGGGPGPSGPAGTRQSGRTSAGRATPGGSPREHRMREASSRWSGRTGWPGWASWGWRRVGRTAALWSAGRRWFECYPRCGGERSGRF